MRLILKKILRTPGAGVIGILILIYLFMAIFKPTPFLTLKNQLNLIREISHLGIICIGMTIVIIGRGIDLSVGSIAGLSGGICASLLLGNFGMPLAITVALLSGIAVGALNGFLITKFDLSDFIVTLGTLYLFRGIYLAWQRGIPLIGYMNDQLWWMAASRILNIPVPFIVFLIPLGLFFTFVMRRSQFGSDVFATGSNPTAAKMVGVRIKNVKLYTYILSGLLSAIAGIVLMARLTSVSPHTGANLELDALGAVLLGGTSLLGGRGSIYGSILGALVISIVRNLVVILGVNPYLVQTVIGIMMLLAIGLDQLSRRAAVMRPISINNSIGVAKEGV
ncbi:MAG: ABC transporter permease [Candidatus Kariarchaeaceae archaeon]